MAVVFSTVTDWIPQGNTRVKYTITAETGSGNTITWKATPQSAQTLCYRAKHYFSYVTVYEYKTYGANPVYFSLRITANSKTSTSESKTAVGAVSAGTIMNASGWVGWTTTSEEVSVSGTGSAYTNFTVDILTNGDEGEKSTRVQNASTSGGDVTPSSGGLNGSFTKVNGTWKQISNGYIKVDGTWKQITNAYTKVGGSWRQM